MYASTKHMYECMSACDTPSWELLLVTTIHLFGMIGMKWYDVMCECVCATSRRSKPTATRNIDERLDSVAQNENTFRNENHRMCFVDHKIQINSRN